MAPPKRYWVKIKVPTEFLAKLPHFPTPISKTRLKKIAAEEKKSTGTQGTPSSKGSSPTASEIVSEKPSAAANQQSLSQFKINSGFKESSTSGLTMNPVSTGHVSLDKSSRAKKWVKKPRQFKTFSGFKVKYVTYKHIDTIKKEKVKQEVISTPKSVSATPDV
jgi:hypothetical protein